ncbi:M48 family metallopeptidase [Arthrobacter sp. SDTb3-6]|uniref:M48 metallopeptidase family protein n=1 Tax=Arthrobacter sp. SDTb3-6 TaxID=2713571 RepID=UPI00159CF59C|nr:M48 family metallopeptidase [Arthrobacter sp. SDTb3-6]NVM97563.1 M48 family metallopeptidase [Arthrobacter sp. SDTb3-6]
MSKQLSPPAKDPRRTPIGSGTPGPLGDSVSGHRAANGAPVVVRRTRRRKNGISAFWEAGRAVVAVPSRLTLEDEQYWVPHMVSRLEGDTRAKAAGGRRTFESDGALMRRCLDLSARYLGSRAVPASVRWVTNQNGRWGSCTHAHRTIRISHHVKGMPEWVLDYVLLHELAHLIHPNHSAQFWAELDGYALQERAKAFLEGASFASARNIQGMGSDMDDDGPGTAAPETAGGAPPGQLF